MSDPGKLDEYERWGVMQIIEADRMSRFRKACPETSVFYDDAEKKTRKLTDDFALAIDGNDGALYAANRVSRDILRVTAEWHIARRGLREFLLHDTTSPVVITK